MPERRAANWDNVRLRCTVIDTLLPNLVSVHIDEQEPEFDEELLHWDSVGYQVCVLVGSDQCLRRDFVPLDLQFPNKVFWLTVGNDGKWRIFRDADAAQPERIAERRDAT